MTGADVWNLSQVSNATLAPISKDAGKANAGGMDNPFESFMQNAGLQDVGDSKAKQMITPTEKSDVAYSKFQNKKETVKMDNANVDEAKLQKANKNKDVLKDFEEQVVQEVADSLGVDVQTLVDAMQMYGFTVMDLLQPQNLGTIFGQLSGIEDSALLLVNEKFEALLSGLQDKKTEILENLQTDMDELVSMMELVDEPEPITNFAEALGEAIHNMDASEQRETDVSQKTVSDVISTPSKDEVSMQEVAESMSKALEDVDKVMEKQEIIEATEINDEDLQDVTQEVLRVESEVSEGEIKAVVTKDKSENQDLFRNEKNEKHVNPSQGQVVANNSATPVENAATTQTYTQTVHVTEMIDRIAEHIRIAVATDATTIEMQLNPENLGKLFLQISSKEGIVQAQITAQNENVREMLQTQMLELQEKLNQAGVKVQAIEVTVASHEFERNLEQNQNFNQQQNENSNQKSSSQRRNLNMDSLDELSGVLSEEEQLAAQIMKDNGNSVDLTA